MLYSKNGKIIILLQIWISLIAILLLCTSTYASKPISVKQYDANTTPFLLQPNRGQVADIHYTPDKEVLYTASDENMNLFCYKNKLRFSFLKREEIGGTKTNWFQNPIRSRMQDSPTVQHITGEVMELNFVGANTNCIIEAIDKQQYYSNYYLPQCPNGILKVPSYKKLIYHDIYPKIDLVIEIGSESSQDVSAKREAANSFSVLGGVHEGIKYSFIVHPGAEPSDIRMQWKGDNLNMELQNGSLHYTNPFGYMQESSPICWQTESSEAIQPTNPLTHPNSDKISASFQLRNHGVSFSLSNYDHTKDLIIDPTLVWGTYFGKDMNKIRASPAPPLACDNSGHFYAVFYAKVNGYASKGTFQTKYNDSGDALIIKFDSSGHKIWGTYYGGSSSDGFSCLTIDKNNNLFLCGGSSSPTGIATNGSYSTKPFGRYNTIVVKLDSSGKRIWGSYFHIFGIGFIKLDKKGDLVLAGDFNSSAFVTKNAYQPKFGGGSFDGTLMKIDSSGKSLYWATYIGGKGSDYISGLDIDTANNYVLCGNTDSSSGMATKNAFQDTICLSYINILWTNNSFICKFTSNCKLLWFTYYGGVVDQAINGIAVNSKNHIIIDGFASEWGSTNFFATPKTYQTINNGSDLFLADFDSSGKRIWGTYYGGYDNDKIDINSLAINSRDEIWICGNSASTGIIPSSDAWQKVNSGNTDGIVACFNSLGYRLYGTFYGGNSDDYPNYITCDKLGSIYISGQTWSKSGLTTSNGYDTIITGKSVCFISRFTDFKCARPYSAGNTTACSQTVSKYITSLNSGSTYSWAATNGTIISGQGTNSVLVKWTGANGKIKVTESNSSGCSDTASTYVNVLGKPIARMLVDSAVCFRDSVSFRDSSKYCSHFLWSFGDTSKLCSDQNPVYRYGTPGKYALRLVTWGNNLCTDTTYGSIHIHPIPNASFDFNMLSAHNYQFMAKDNSLSYYHWYFGDSTDSIASSVIQHTYSKDASYKSRLLVKDNIGCKQSYDTTLSIITGMEGKPNTGFDLNVQPNPAKEVIYLSYTLQESDNLKISLIDMQGREHKLWSGKSERGTHEIVFPLNEYAQGIYELKLTSNEHQQLKKLIIYK